MTRTEAASTPGPWRVFSGVSASCYGRYPDGVLSTDIYPVESDRYEDRIASGVHVAHARLIAAAPELLAALRALFDDYKRLADSGDAGYWHLEGLAVGQQALAAIAKAEGQ